MTAKILLVGAFGQNNPGDEALLEAFLRELRGCEIVVASRDPDRTARDHGCRTVDSGSPAAVLQKLHACDAVVVGGGTVFKRLHPSSGRHPLDLLRKTRGLQVAARVLGARFALIGVGVGDLRDRAAGRHARAIAKAAHLLVVRDEESAQALARLGAGALCVGADAAWVLQPALQAALAEGDAPASPDAPADVVVALSVHAGGDALPTELAQQLRGPVDAGVEVVLQPWQDDGGADDVALARATGEALGSRVRIWPAPADLAGAAHALRRAQLVVTARFHGLLAAAIAGVPAIAVGHEAKLRGLAARLGQPAVPLDGLGEALRAVQAGELAPRAAPEAAIEQEVRRARAAFAALEELLQPG